MGKRTTPPRICRQDGVVVLLVHRNWEVVTWGRDQPHLTIVSKMGVGKRSTPSRVCERDEVVVMWGREQPHLAFGSKMGSWCRRRRPTQPSPSFRTSIEPNKNKKTLVRTKETHFKKKEHILKAQTMRLVSFGPVFVVVVLPDHPRPLEHQ